MRCKLSVVLVLVAGPLTAQSGSTRLAGRVPAAVLPAIDSIIGTALAESLPTEPLVQKALEGSAKNIPPDRLVSGVRRGLLQLRRRHQPGVRLPQIRRQFAGITLRIERLLQPRINWAHRTTSSSASSNASRARCTRILSVGMRAPVTAAISS